MSFLWLSGICLALLVLLLFLGESTLFLFGGNRELAARVYKAVFMFLAAGLVAGVVPYLFTRVRDFGDRMVVEAKTRANHVWFDNFLTFYENYARYMFEYGAKILPFFFLIAGIVMAVYIYLTE